MSNCKNSKNKWSADVQEKWHPEEGFFEQSSEKIAEGLKNASDSLVQAVDRLDFYINRAGSNLQFEDKARLEKAKSILDELYK